MAHTSTQADDDLWVEVLAHRDREALAVVRERFVTHGVPAAVVAASLDDVGAALAAAAASGARDWSAPYGGLVGAALVAGEVAAYSSSLVSRAAAVRSFVVDALLDDVSAVSLARTLGVSRQKVYEIARSAGKLRSQTESG